MKAMEQSLWMHTPSNYNNNNNYCNKKALRQRSKEAHRHKKNRNKTQKRKIGSHSNVSNDSILILWSLFFHIILLSCWPPMLLVSYMLQFSTLVFFFVARTVCLEIMYYIDFEAKNSEMCPNYFDFQRYTTVFISIVHCTVQRDEWNFVHIAAVC